MTKTSNDGHPSAPSNGSTSTDLALAGWDSPLATGVTAALWVLAITGLWIWLAPFSVASQLQVLLHTLLGVIITFPAALYLWRHLKVWWKQKMTAAMVLGYGNLAMLIVATVSGFWLSWLGAVGPARSPLWDLVHLVSGIALTVLLPAHLCAAVLRRLPSRKTHPRLVPSMRRFAYRNLILVLLCGLPVGILHFSWPRPGREIPIPEGYGLPAFAQQFEEYRGNPFAPTYARTESGMLIDPAVLSRSSSCGTSGCHEQIYAEWAPSAHRFSAMNPPFQQVQKNFANEREPAETRYCAGCHDPISLFAGAKDIQNMEVSSPGIQEGCSCVVCHSISAVDERGNADYVLTPPTSYLWESRSGWRKALSDFLIRSYPQKHLEDYDRNILRTPEFCGSCHKQFIPEALNRFGVSPGQNQYDEWRNSHWHVAKPELSLSCRDCHMRLVPNSSDPGRGEGSDTRRRVDDGAHRHHGTIATNVFIPELMKLPGWERHVALSKEWMRGETKLPELGKLWPKGPVASIEIHPSKAPTAGEQLELRVVITNRKVGHNFTTGPLDFTRSWVHLRVADARGNLIAERGAIDPNTRAITDTPGRTHVPGNSRKEGTMVLEAVPLDAEGNPLVKHELWRKAGGEALRVIFPRYSDNQLYRIPVPIDAVGPLRITADLNFRRYRQEFLDKTVPTLEKDSGVFQPTVTQSSTTLSIPLQGKRGTKR